MANLFQSLHLRQLNLHDLLSDHGKNLKFDALRNRFIYSNAEASPLAGFG